MLPIRYFVIADFWRWSDSEFYALTGPQLFERVMGAAPINAAVLDASIARAQHHGGDQEHAHGKQQKDEAFGFSLGSEADGEYQLHADRGGAGDPERR
jgi:hypothetical protein